MLFVLRSCQLGVFPPCCFGLFGLSLERCLAVGGALTAIIYWKRECWLVFISVNYCVFANFAAMRCCIHSHFRLEGMVCSIVVSMLQRRK